MATHWTLGCDAKDPHLLADFWATALGYVSEPGYDDPDGASIVDPEGKGPAIGWLRVPEGKAAKNRIHIDIRVAGEGQSDLIEAYQHAIALQAEPRIVVDLSRVTFMDSTALGTLVAAVKRVKVRGGTLSVVGASDRIASLFHITKLDTVVPLCPEPGDARGVVVNSP